MNPGTRADRRVLALVKAFLGAGILSPLLANIALAGLDEHFAAKWAALGPEWKRVKPLRGGGAAWKLVRYADDFVVLVAGTPADAQALRGEVAAVLAPMGLRLSADKTRVCHIDEGFEFLGWRIQRRTNQGPASGTSTPGRRRSR